MNNRYSLFTNLIKNIFNNVQKIRSKEMEKLGLKGSSIQCIFYLYEDDRGKTPQDLCILCNEDKAAISRTLQYLTNLNLISTKKEDNKIYKNLIILTEEGRKIGKIIEEKIDNIWEQGSQNLKQNEIEDFYKTLSKINENVNTICKKYGENND